MQQHARTPSFGVLFVAPSFRVKLWEVQHVTIGFWSESLSTVSCIPLSDYRIMWGKRLSQGSKNRRVDWVWSSHISTVGALKSVAFLYPYLEYLGISCGDSQCVF